MTILSEIASSCYYVDHHKGDDSIFNKYHCLMPAILSPCLVSFSAIVLRPSHLLRIWKPHGSAIFAHQFSPSWPHRQPMISYAHYLSLIFYVTVYKSIIIAGINSASASPAAARISKPLITPPGQSKSRRHRWHIISY